MRPLAAGALVFVTSAAVLVLEIVAARLLAPYVGVTLETYTAIIGTILAAISLGTWVGGRLADRLDPRMLLGPILILGGALSLGIVPIVRLVGSAAARRWAGRGAVARPAGVFRPGRGALGGAADGDQAAVGGPRRDRPDGGPAVRARHRRGHLRHLRHRVRAGGDVAHVADRVRRGDRADPAGWA